MEDADIQYIHTEERMGGKCCGRNGKWEMGKWGLGIGDWGLGIRDLDQGLSESIKEKWQ